MSRAGCQRPRSWRALRSADRHAIPPDRPTYEGLPRGQNSSARLSPTFPCEGAGRDAPRAAHSAGAGTSAGASLLFSVQTYNNCFDNCIHICFFTLIKRHTNAINTSSGCLRHAVHSSYCLAMPDCVFFLLLVCIPLIQSLLISIAVQISKLIATPQIA